MTIRLIPRLDIKGPNLVKGVHLEGLRVLGKPWQYAKYYYDSGADELLYIDVTASLYGRNSLLDIIERTSQEIFIPLTVGGGIRSIEDIRGILRAGADKVSLNTAAIQHPGLISEGARRFGSSTIVIAIEAKRREPDFYEAYTDNGRIRTGVEVLSWAKQVQELGAGEILLTSIDREGTGGGFDIELVRKVSEAVTIPVIACGGAGNRDHIASAAKQGKADAVAVASILHYNYLNDDILAEDYSVEGNLAFLTQRRINSRLEETSLPSIKDYLSRSGLSVRE